MKSLLPFALVLCLTAPFTGIAQAQCTTPVATSFSLSPNKISGDESELATGTVQGCVPQNSMGFYLGLYPSGFSSTKTICYGGGLSSQTCNYPNIGPGNTTVSFAINGYNHGTTDQTGTYGVDAYGYPPLIYQSITVTGIADPYEPPYQDPDGPCPPDKCNSAGNPINVTNGNTWIPQQDYLMPGIGGGLRLTRTWNSLWANMNPPEVSGIFGDSWRSTFEEHIQSLTGGVVKYWKGNGSSLFYSYNSLSGTYSLTAPTDDQTTVSYNSTTQLWTIAQKDGTQRTFNSAGYLTSIVDLNGNTTTINVDATNQNRIASITDPSGHVLTFNYATPGFPRLCSSITDAVGTFTQYSYDTSGRLTRVQYPDGSQYNFQFNDPNGNTLISLVTDSRGKTIEAHTYDTIRRGKISQQANDSSGRPVNKVTVSYATPNPWQNQVCDSTGNDCISVQVSNRNQRHYISLTSGPANNACNSCGFLGQSSATLTATGYKNSSTDASGNTTLYTYDSQGNMTSMSQRDYFTPTWDTWNYTYNSFGEVLTATDPLGAAGDPNHTTKYAYDAHGNLLNVTTPSPDGGITSPSVTTFTPNAQGQVTTIQDPLLNATTITYCTTNQTNCPYGLIYYVKDAKGNKTTYSYDGRGNRLSVTDALGKVTQFQYDAMNRVTLITYPTSTATTVQFHYDWRGRRDYVIDQNNNKTVYAYDDADRLISVTDSQTPTSGVTTYAYDTENNLTDIYDAKNNHTQFLYYPGKILYKTIFPSTQYETYVFDSNNNLASITDRISNTINYTYDFQNHLYRKSEPNGYAVTYTYDPAGRMKQVQDSNTGATGTYTFTYDNMNRLTSAGVNYTFNNAGTLTVQYGYDKASNRNSMTDPQNVSTIYGYDVLNRLSSLTYNGQTPNFTFGYDALSRRNLLTRPNGINTSYGYDAVSRLLSVLHQLGTTTLDGATYTYDNAGNRKTRTDKRTNITLTYGYDNIYQLKTVKQSTTTNESYTYDLVGNRLSSLGVSPYTYNSSNELTALPSGNYTYDSNGNTRSKPDGTTYTWDVDNRLTQVVLPGTGGTVTFKYDPFGRRIQKSFTQGSTTTTTNYLYDFVNLLEDVDQNGNVLARYTQGPLVDEPLAELRSGTTSYYQQDSLGTVTSLSNSTGALNNTYTYDSFGRLTASSGTTYNPIAYSGRELDTETGGYYHRARYYDQSTGRFLTEDPLGFRGGINFYRYVANNPVNFSDPSGLKVSKCCRTTQVNWFVDFLSGLTGLKHCYIKTDTKAAGMGPAGNGPLPACPLFTQTQIRDHSSESGGDCHEIPNVDESCVNRELQVGASTGPWTPLNQCNSFVNGVLDKCRTGCKSGQATGPGFSTMTPF